MVLPAEDPTKSELGVKPQEIQRLVSVSGCPAPVVKFTGVAGPPAPCTANAPQVDAKAGEAAANAAQAPHPRSKGGASVWLQTEVS